MDDDPLVTERRDSFLSEDDLNEIDSQYKSFISRDSRTLRDECISALLMIDDYDID